FIVDCLCGFNHYPCILGVHDAKGSKNGVPGSNGQRFRGHPPDETSISMIVDMGFPRSR
ncbi:hypothetical protein KI387_034531, partial [Taxus chinensis]